MKQHVVVLSHSPFIGGGELALKSLIDSTNNRYRWTVIVPGNTPIDSAVTSADVEYISLPSLPWWCYEAHSSPPKVNKSQLNKSLDSLREIAQNADLLMTNTITIPWLGLIAHELQKPHIWYVHEYGDIDHNLQFIAGYDETLNIIAECSSRVLTISNDVKAHIGRVIPHKKIDIIHQSINMSELTTLPVASSFNKLSLLCMGAIKPSKGQHIALEAVSALPDVTLDIIGPAADHQFAYDLQQQAKDLPNVSVQIRRYKPLDELSSHNVVLMCSENEGLGRVTLEALAAGRLVIGYDCRSTRELLDNNRGLIYSPNMASSLKKIIKAVTDNTHLVNLDAGRSFVCREFSDESQAKDFDHCVTNALKSEPIDANTLLLYLDILEANNLWESPRQKVLIAVKRLIPKPAKHFARRFMHRF